MRASVNVVCVLNGVPPRGPRQRQAREVLADIGVGVRPASLGLRAAVDYAAAAGLSAQGYEPGGKAAAEIDSVYAVIRELAELSHGESHGRKVTRNLSISFEGRTYQVRGHGRGYRLRVDRAKAEQQSRPTWKPAPDHPWRRGFKPEASEAAAG